MYPHFTFRPLLPADSFLLGGKKEMNPGFGPLKGNHQKGMVFLGVIPCLIPYLSHRSQAQIQLDGSNCQSLTTFVQQTDLSAVYIYIYMYIHTYIYIYMYNCMYVHIYIYSISPHVFHLFFPLPGHSQKLRRQHRAVAAVLLLRRRRVHPGALRPRGPGAPGARSEREQSASGWVGSGLRPWGVKGLGFIVFFWGWICFCVQRVVAWWLFWFGCLLACLLVCWFVCLW